MKIAIIGAGNMGTAIAADLARNNAVSVYSSKPIYFNDKLMYVDSSTGQSFESKLSFVSDDYEMVLAGG